MASDSIKDFIATSLWGRKLGAEELRRVLSDSSELLVDGGQTVCHRGVRAEYWYGVADGLLKVSNVTRGGRPTSLIGIPTGGWFGEGSVLKSEIRPYDVVALRESRLALVPSSTFHWLMDTSLAFNRFLIEQLNARLAQFVIRLEHFRSSAPEKHVAHCLAELFNAELYPGTASKLQISQEEIAYLAGVSRQLANRTLHRLEEAKVLQASYGSIRILDIEALRAFASLPDE
ncbi:Crp/Fnr family transcriptional regulator [Pseudoduganella namucuonensis]|uniref:Transcriptional regulator, Crp/Fnr family n=1 Tax=Pseudoduganella namucuonensis TaxID=1035707 RepID=A0A1I7LHR4_9BURK|nr:Crp/Fnr family transcriptional regulator [Pseudoduganella namucuonensis]SFV09215.1 transcriptional regulator, Crp/Fnr family [Pseudoduganella namucuonensis]